jgi:hypothetical protein
MRRTETWQQFANWEKNQFPVVTSSRDEDAAAKCEPKKMKVDKGQG